MKNNQITNLLDKAMDLTNNKDYSASIVAYRKVIEKIDNWLEKNSESDESGSYFGLKAYALANLAYSYKQISEKKMELQTAFDALKILENPKICNEDKTRGFFAVAFLENSHLTVLNLYKRAYDFAESNHTKAIIKQFEAKHIFNRTKNTQESIEILKNILILNDIDDIKSEILSDISFYYIQDHDYKNAEAFSLLALNSNPTDSQKLAIYTDLAQIYFELGNEKKCIELNKQILQMTEDKKQIITAYNNLMVASNKFENFEETIKYFNKAIKVNTQNNNDIARLYIALSHAFFSLKKHEKAIEACTEGLKLATEDQTKLSLSINLAATYANNGSQKLAIMTLKKAILNTDDKTKQAKVLTMAGNIRAAEGKYEQAQKFYNEALNTISNNNNPYTWFIKTSLVEQHIEMYYEWILSVHNDQIINNLLSNTLDEIEEIKNNFDKIKELDPDDVKQIKQTILRCEKILNKQDKVTIDKMSQMIKDNQFENFLITNGINIVLPEDIESIKMWTLLPVSNLVKQGKVNDETNNFSSGLTSFNRMLEFYTIGIYWKFLTYCEDKYTDNNQYDKLEFIKKQKQNIQTNRFKMIDFCKTVAPYEQLGTKQPNADFIEFLNTLPFGQGKSNDELKEKVLEFEAKMDIFRKFRNKASHLNIDTENENTIEQDDFNKINLSNFVTISNLVLFQKNSIIKDVQTMFGDFFEKNQKLKTSAKQTTLKDFIK